MTSVVESLAPAHRVIQVTHTGDLAAADLRGSGLQVLALAQETGIWHVLTDCSAVTGTPGALALLNLAEAAAGRDLPADFKQALVWPDEAAARLSLDYWKTAEDNQGLNAKLFHDREAALAWLEA